MNEDLLSRGVKFIMDTSENMLMDWNELSSDDIVIIPPSELPLRLNKN